MDESIGTGGDVAISYLYFAVSRVCRISSLFCNSIVDDCNCELWLSLSGCVFVRVGRLLVLQTSPRHINKIFLHSNFFSACVSAGKQV